MIFYYFNNRFHCNNIYVFDCSCSRMKFYSYTDKRVGGFIKEILVIQSYSLCAYDLHGETHIMFYTVTKLLLLDI